MLVPINMLKDNTEGIIPYIFSEIITNVYYLALLQYKLSVNLSINELFYFMICNYPLLLIKCFVDILYQYFPKNVLDLEG